MKSKAIMLAALLLCAAAGQASAAVFFWTGAASGYWGNENNWDNAGCSVDCYPHTTDDDVLIDAEDTIILDGDYDIEDLTVSDVILLTTDSTARTVTCESITFTDVNIVLQAEAALVVE